MRFKCRKKNVFLLIACIVVVLYLTIVFYQQWSIFVKADIERKLVKQLGDALLQNGFIALDHKHLLRRSKQQPTSKREISPTWIEPPWKPSLRGHLNVHIWLDWCGSTVSDLRRNIHFPKFPDIRVKTSMFSVTHDALNYGQRIFGYLHPPKTGFYTFAISSDDTSELWLSTDTNPSSAQLIAWVGNRNDPVCNWATDNLEFQKYPSQLSHKLFLREGNRYFVEALHKQSDTANHLLVSWQIPGQPSFSFITSSRISQYNLMHDHASQNYIDVTQLSQYIPLTPATLEPALDFPSLREAVHSYNHISNTTGSRKIFNTNIRSIADSVLPTCNYSPSYTADFKLRHFEGVYLIHETAVYPYDNTNLGHMEQYKLDTDTRRVDSHGKFIYENEHDQYDENEYRNRKDNEGRYGNNVDNEDIYMDNVDSDGIYRNRMDNEGYEVADNGPRLLRSDYSQKGRENLEAAISNILSFSRPKQKVLQTILRTSTESLNSRKTIEKRRERGTRSILSLSRKQKRSIFEKNVRTSSALRNAKNVSRNNTEINSRKNTKKVREHTINTTKNIVSLSQKGKTNISKKSLRTASWNSRNVSHNNAELNSRKHIKKVRDRNNIFTSRRILSVFKFMETGDHQKPLPGNGARVSKRRRRPKVDGDTVRSGVTRKRRSETGRNEKSKVEQILQSDKSGYIGIARNKTRNNDTYVGITRNNRRKKPSGDNDSYVGIRSRSYVGTTRSKNMSNDSYVGITRSKNKDNDSYVGIRSRSYVGITRSKNRDNDSYVGIRSKKKRHPSGDNDSYLGTIRNITRQDMTSKDELALTKNETTPIDGSSKKKAETYLNNDRSPGSKNSRVIEMAVTKLQESGDWELVLSYAKEKDLIVTQETLRYVIWKYLRYKKPKRVKILPYIYKQNYTLSRLDGNLLLNKDVVKAVVLKYLNVLQNKYSSDVQLVHIVNIEENHDVLYGDRYLIELDVKLTDSGEIVRLSDYVYLPLGATTSLCSPKNFIWKKTATVHVIVPVKNQGKWVQHFINDMAELYDNTLDRNLNVIIVDFSSSDIDIEKAFARSSLKRYQVLKVNGSFQRALGVQMGANLVENPDDILFTCDLHLEMPNNLIHIIRKHCIQGKMAFSPIVLRLGCGFTPSLPYGEWETLGYGLFAIFKSDFEKIGGMNMKEFTTKWGGEDWDMVDRCLQAGMEIERLRVPMFYHFYHSKSGLWGSLHEENILTNNDYHITHEDQTVPPYLPNEDPYIQYRHNDPLSPRNVMQ